MVRRAQHHARTYLRCCDAGRPWSPQCSAAIFAAVPNSPRHRGVLGSPCVRGAQSRPTSPQGAGRSSPPARPELHAASRASGRQVVVRAAAAARRLHAAAVADARKLVFPAPLLRLDLRQELVQPKRVSLLSRLPLKLHRRAARPCGRLGAPEALIGLKPLRANRAVLSAAAVLVVATRLRAVQRAGARAVGKQRLVVHTVRVLGAKAGAHALVLVEQPLVVHDLPAANLCHPERDLLADVAVAVSRKLGLFRSAVRAAVPGFEAALALALAPPLLAQLVALPPRLALLTRLVVARRRRRQVQTVVVHAAATIAAASAAGRRRRVGAWLRMPAAATAELAAWQGRWLARVHARRHAERATLLQARLHRKLAQLCLLLGLLLLQQLLLHLGAQRDGLARLGLRREQRL
mmetsp:Transcript_28358/g.83935  ORF Transcript_28358/g.83935 Transcript_28358/m.83935 type:complete len:407 (-) Transcript_28358:1045-2265(-)